MEGYMNKVGRLSKMAKSRYFILEDRFLYYFEKHTDADPKGAIFLQGSSITVEADGSRGKYGLVVCNGRQGRRRVFYCNSRDEQDQWLHALAKAANIASIHEFFDIGYEDTKIQIGKGKFSIVYQAVRRDATKEKLAVKVIQKKGVGEDDREYMRTEIAVLRLVNHPNIVRMVDMFDELISCISSWSTSRVVTYFVDSSNSRGIVLKTSKLQWEW
jgi:doublecortin-like kinase 3